ncbi:gamma-glutamyl phosphate reductase [Actinospica durhamensis]|uniref:long-chain-fatty-acyl-CoA reductase n=1 Tax=Actinospica durhamensis TaxID=1508375 RepID=A0A941EID5_9ACTN|nr:acyl-CoA reductase [Actinospica durhamensis]MBR7831786.1 gamma-glutamyl phosphate reductase [Actinospica durhamensis]
MLLQHFPEERELPLEQVLAGLRAADRAPDRLGYGDERVLDFLDALSHELLRPRLVRRHPELAPLGFFLRRSRLAQWTRATDGAADLRVPRGIVFHIPPANVSTLLAYPWALSMLAGNANVIRLSTRGSAATDELLGVLRETVRQADPAVRASQLVVSYGHDDEVTAALSAACHLRLMWGGDQTIDRLRRFALAPGARDLPMPERSSLCVVSAATWQGTDEAGRTAVVEGFYNDAYWYGQAACASPLTICWIGPDGQAARAGADFVDRLEALVAQRRPQIDVEMAVEKRVATYGLAVTASARSVGFRGNALAVVSLSPGRLLESWCGTGTFGLACFPDLDALAPLITRRHQTIGHFGFERDTLLAFARRLAGRGVDRLVPVGEALAFERVWDGYDLLYECSKAVTVRLPTTPPLRRPAAVAGPTGP